MFEKIKLHFLYDKTRYENLLDDRKNKIGVYINKFITFLVISFAFALVIESVGDNTIFFGKQFFIFDLFVSSVFAIEYLYRIIKSKDRIKFLISPIRTIDLLSFLPFFLGFFASGDVLKILRLLRIFRVFKLIRKIPLTNLFVKSLKDYLDEYKAVFILFFVIIFIGSFFVYYVEKDIVGTKFTSIPVTLRWGLVTMTTVGFGDIYPTTNTGRFLGSFLVFLGPLILALASAVTIMVFMETSKKHEVLSEHHRGKACSRCKTRNTKDSNFCYKCGEKIKN